jgi:hypothetical protein
MPGWTLDESPSVGPADARAVKSAPEGQSDFVGKSFATVKDKYDLDTSRAAAVDVGLSRKSRLVRAKSDKTQDDNVLNSRTVLVIDGKVKAVQG